MHLSTSSSEHLGDGVPSAPSRRRMSASTGIIALLAGLGAILLALELASPVILTHFSRIERREQSEGRAADSLRAFTADGRPTVLLLGNSLLIEGVQIDNLRDSLAAHYAVSRFGIEQTHYLDWY